MANPTVDTHLDVITTVTEDGAAVPLTGTISTQEHIYRKPDGSLLTKTTALVTPPGTDGQIHYELTAAEHDQFGRWEVEYHVVHDGKTIRSSQPKTWVTANRLYSGDDDWRVALPVLRAYVSESGITYTIAAIDEKGNEYSLTGRTLRLRIEDSGGTDLQTVEDGSITKGTHEWSFDLDAAVTAAAAKDGSKHYWALFDVTSGVELLQWGRFEVVTAPVSDT